jgi:hypothetical protein
MAPAATRTYAGQILHLMRAAGLDPASATRALTKIPASSPQLAKHALEAHVTRVLVGGYEHESFYLDGSLSSLLDPAAFRRERYTQFRDMRGMEPRFHSTHKPNKNSTVRFNADQQVRASTNSQYGDSKDITKLR